jgi:putative ABC transport system ATP-binding protein
MARAAPPVQVSVPNRWFGRGEGRKQAIWDVGLPLAPGSLAIPTGPSGSGKTTVLTLMGCLREVPKVSVRRLGEERHGAGEAAQVARRLRHGFIFQAHNLHNRLTARQNVLMGLELHRGVLGAAMRDLTLVGLGERIAYLPGNL